MKAKDENEKIETTNKWNKKQIGIIAILFTIFIGIYLLIITNHAGFIDNGIYDLIKQFRSEAMTKMFIFITHMGDARNVVIISIVISMILFVYKKKKESIGLLLSIATSSVIYVVLKAIFQRPRPPMEERLIEETGYSFPSGHTLNNTVLYIFLIYLIQKNIKHKALKNILSIILALIPIFIGISRVYVRVHYPTDVIAGFCLGIIFVILFIHFIYHKIKV